MTETPGRPDEPSAEETTAPTAASTSEPTTEETPKTTEPTGETTAEQTEPTAETTAEQTEPIPAQTSEPTTEETAHVTQSGSRLQWFDRPNRLNRIAALVAIIAGAVVVVGGIFGTGVMVGAHTSAHSGDLERPGHHSEMSAGPRRLPIGQIWIVPGGGDPNGLSGYGAGQWVR